MTLTACPVTRNDANGSLQIPRPLLAAAVAITTADALGLRITQAHDQHPAAVVEVTGDADWYWSNADGVAVANMRKVPANVPERFQVPPGATGVSIYAKTATTANLMPAIVQ